MKIGVIIVTYNAAKWIDKCIKPLKEVSDNNKVYIIDNGSSDGTQEVIKSKFPQFIFHETNQNLGFGKANNLGLKMAVEDGMDYFFLLNQDAHVSWDNIHKLAVIQSQNPDYGIVSPLQMFSDTRVDYLHYKTLFTEESQYFNDLISDNKLEDVYPLKYTNAAIWMISKDCLKSVGGFEPIFPHYGEDNEYAQRIHYFGFKFGLCPNIKGFHYRKQDVQRIKNKAFFFNLYLNELKDLNKNIFGIYLKMFVRIIFGIILSPFKKSDITSLGSISTCFQLLFIFPKIRKNRKMNTIKEYCFL